VLLSVVTVHVVSIGEEVRDAIAHVRGFFSPPCGGEVYAFLWGRNAYKEKNVPPLVPPSRRVEAVERLNEHGDVLIPLDEASLKSALASL